MDVVNESELKTKKFIDRGNFATVYKVELDGKDYAYKVYNDIYPFIQEYADYFYKYLNVKYPKEFLINKFFVSSSKGNYLNGYLSCFKDDLKELDFIYVSLEEKIKALKKAKKLLEFLHKNYGFVHGDIHGANLLFDKNNNPYYLDFDTMFKSTVGPTYFSVFSTLAEYYIYYYGADCNLDKYLFNITTVALLENISENDVFEYLKNTDDIRWLSNKDVKKLSKELLLTDVRHNYSGEYIVDHL